MCLWNNRWAANSRLFDESFKHALYMWAATCEREKEKEIVTVSYVPME
jgi:hypothetical protein